MDIGFKTMIIGFALGLVLPIVITVVMFGSSTPAIFWSMFMFTLMFSAVAVGIFFALCVGLTQQTEKTWQVTVDVYENRQGNLVMYHDRAKRIGLGEAGKFGYKLKSSGEVLEPQDMKYLLLKKTGKTHMNLYKIQAGVYQPMLVTSDGSLKIIPESMRLFVATQTQKNYEKHYKKFGVEKYLPIMMVVIVGFVIMMVIYTGFGKMNEVVTNIANIQAQQNALFERITGLAGFTPAGVPTTTPVGQVIVPS